MRQSDPFVERHLIAWLRARPISRLEEVVRRPGFALRAALDRLYECTHPDLPLLSPGAVRRLAAILTEASVGFEWGSGASTLWFAVRCGRLVSIEHDRRWYDYMAARIPANVDYRLVEADPVDQDWNRQPYVTQIHQFPNETFDFCLIDGHYREACLKAALLKVRPGGWLIADDTQWWDPPVECWGVPSNWRIDTRAWTWTKETTIWQRPF
jgi:hypothetical protein